MNLSNQKGSLLGCLRTFFINDDLSVTSHLMIKGVKLNKTNMNKAIFYQATTIIFNS